MSKRPMLHVIVRACGHRFRWRLMVLESQVAQGFESSYIAARTAGYKARTRYTSEQIASCA